MVSIDVNAWWKFEVVVNLSPAKVGQVKLEALEMENEVVRHLLEASSILVSFS